MVVQKAPANDTRYQEKLSYYLVGPLGRKMFRRKAGESQFCRRESQRLPCGSTLKQEVMVRFTHIQPPCATSN